MKIYKYMRKQTIIIQFENKQIDLKKHILVVKPQIDEKKDHIT